MKALENGSQERLKKKNGRKSDFEMETRGVKGRRSIFSLIPHQPLTSPTDVMHQLFLCVCKDLFLYYYERLRKEKNRTGPYRFQNRSVKRIPRKIRPLKDIATLKAKDFKAYLLYLAPIVFPDFVFGEDRNSDIEDLNNESNNEADMCNSLLNGFCLSTSEKTDQFESINFYQLSHLGWQAKNIGPLFPSSASMFESANHRVIFPLTGKVNHCQLLVTRYRKTEG